MRCLLVLAAASLTSLAHAEPEQKPKQMIVVPAGAAKLVPADPARPHGAKIAVLSGDPAAGPSTMLMEMPRASGVLHVHSSDYHLVVLEGTMKHRGERETEAAAKPLGPGSYWFQPGGQPHADSCLSERCLMFITWAGKRDGRVVTAK